jgi:hypothetical protein
MGELELNWRSFADYGNGKDMGPICSKWNLQGTPTLFLLDHKGVIRYRWLGKSDDKKIDEAIEALLKEAAGEGKKNSK